MMVPGKVETLTNFIFGLVKIEHLCYNRLTTCLANLDHARLW